MSSLLTTLFGAFSGNQQPNNQAQPQPNNQPGTPGNIPPGTGLPANQLPNTAPNGAVPEQKPEPAPMDEFEKLWENDTTGAKTEPIDNSIFGKVNSDDLLKAASQIDFRKAVTPELLQAASAGGEAGVAALMEVINKVSQLNYAQSTQTSTALIEQAIAKAREQFAAELPKQIRDRNAFDLINENPVLSHPAAQPLIESLVSRMQVKYPNASPAELKDNATRYIVKFAESVLSTQPQAKEAVKKNAAKETDWNTYL